MTDVMQLLDAELSWGKLHQLAQRGRIVIERTASDGYRMTVGDSVWGDGHDLRHLVDLHWDRMNGLLCDWIPVDPSDDETDGE